MKWSFDFEMEIGASILKWSFDFKIELRFQLKDFSRDLLDRKKARDFSTCVLALVYSPVFIVAKSQLTKRREEKRMGNGGMRR